MTPGMRRWRGLALVAAVAAALHVLLLDRLTPPSQHRSVTAGTVGASLSVRQLAPDAPARPDPPVVSESEVVPGPMVTPASAVHATSARGPHMPAAPNPPPQPATEPAGEPPPAPWSAPQTPPVTPPANPAATALAGRIPAPMRLRYELTASTRGITLSGQAELNWRHDGQHYDARLELRLPPLPARRQHSTGQLTPQGLEPARFSEQRRGEEAVHFDRSRAQLVFSNNRDEAVLQPGAQDRLSVVLQLGALLVGRAGAAAPGEVISLQVVGTREAQAWDFTLEGEETLDLPGGTVSTVRLVRQPRKESDQKVELWLAPGRDYAPVRLRLTQPNGDWLDQQWSGTDRP